MRKRYATGGIVLAILASSGLAAADSKVRGKVADSKGAALEGVEVSVTDSTSGRGYHVKTGKDGTFYQRGVMPATYKIILHKAGFTDHIIEEVNVQAGVERSFEITLKTVDERSSEMRQTTSYGSAVDAFQRGDFEAAIQKADEAIAKDEKDARAWDLKGKALVKRKRFADAIPLFEKELTLEGAPPDTKTLLSTCAFNAGVLASNLDRTADAIAFWEKALALGSEEPQLENVLGRAYLARQEFRSAAEHLAAYLAKNPSAEDAEEVRTLLSEIQKLGSKK